MQVLAKPFPDESAGEPDPDALIEVEDGTNLPAHIGDELGIRILQGRLFQPKPDVSYLPLGPNYSLCQPIPSC
jgi:hypothetical protein